MISEEVLEAYIPADRRLAIVNGQSLPDRMVGAALFADISGFTPLAENLAKTLGPKRGAEELTRQLNSVYNALIAEADRYQGSVIGFSGDAITCWFNRDTGIRAMASALAMQHAMQQFAALSLISGAEFALAIKVALACGPVRRFRVGNPHIQYLDVLAGAIMDRLSAAERQAIRGEIIACPEVVQYLAKKIKVNEWRPGHQPGDRFAVVSGPENTILAEPWPNLALREMNIEQVSQWILPQVFERLTTGQGQLLAELRPAVALFINFCGIDYDHDDFAGEKLDAFISWVQGVMARQEGFLIDLTIGDKGSYIYSAFGAPITHEDDPARALRAAQELQCLPTELNYINQIQIGISRGKMRVGPYGGKTRRTYGVLGDEVNLAARLMSKAAPGQILVSQAIADSACEDIFLQPCGSIIVKGKSTPAPVFELKKQGEAAPQRSRKVFANPIIGRESELAQLTQVLEKVISCQGQILRLQGPAGIGKSRLAAELLHRAGRMGFKCTQAVCQAISLGAYAPWRQLFRSLFGIGELLEGAGGSTNDFKCQIGALECFINQANPAWLLRLPLLGDLLGLPIPDNATTAAFEPRLRQNALFDLLGEIVQYWARLQPLFLLIDDAHAMDEASRSLTLALSRAIGQARILIVLVHRPSMPDAPILPELNSIPCHHLMILGELSSQAVSIMLSQRLGNQPNSLSLSLIQAVTQGNPFFIEEVSNALLGTGQLVPRPDGGWGLSESLFQALNQADILEYKPGHWSIVKGANLSAVDLGLPDSIQGVVLSRIDSLPEAPRLTLKVASVVGRTFSLNVLAETHPIQVDAENLLAQTRFLEMRDFVYLENPARQLYAFKHPVIQEVTYETLLFEQRCALHKSVSEVLERMAPEVVDELAYHTFLGQDWQRAFHYQALAGKQAQKIFANKEGIEHYLKALQSAEHLSQAETVGQRQNAHVSLGELLAATGQYEPALQHLHIGLELAAGLLDYERQAHACRYIAYVHEFRSDYSRALEWIDQGLAVLKGRRTATTAELLAIAGLIQTRQGNYERARELCDECICLAEALGELTSLAFAQNSRAIIDYSLGHSGDAIQHFRKAADLYRQANNIHGQALSYNGMGNAYQNMGQWSEATTYLLRAAEIFNQTGDELHRGFANNNLGEIARSQGKLDEALAYYQAALHSLELTGSPAYLLGILHMNLGATYVRKKEIDSAYPHLWKSSEYFEQSGARDFLAELHRYLSDASLIAGELDNAERLGQHALSLARELRMRGEEGKSLRSLGEIAFARGNIDLAEQYFEESLMILKEINHEYESTCSLLALVKVRAAQKMTQRVIPELEFCIQTFEKLGACLDLEEALKLKEGGLNQN